MNPVVGRAWSGFEVASAVVGLTKRGDRLCRLLNALAKKKKSGAFRGSDRRDDFAIFSRPLVGLATTAPCFRWPGKQKR